MTLLNTEGALHLYNVERGTRVSWRSPSCISDEVTTGRLGIRDVAIDTRAVRLPKTLLSIENTGSARGQEMELIPRYRNDRNQPTITIDTGLIKARCPIGTQGLAYPMRMRAGGSSRYPLHWTMSCVQVLYSYTSAVYGLRIGSIPIANMQSRYRWSTASKSKFSGFVVTELSKCGKPENRGICICKRHLCMSVQHYWYLRCYLTAKAALTFDVWMPGFQHQWLSPSMAFHNLTKTPSR